VFYCLLISRISLVAKKVKLNGLFTVSIHLFIYSSGRFDDAITIGTQALQHLPNDPQINYQVANIYGKKEKYRESERHFLRAIKVKESALFQTNLGVLYHRWGKYSKAEKAYVRSLELDPSTQNSAHEYVGMIRQKIKKKSG
jgi:tetratricopeptide (TPR) repeat protein